MLLVGNAQGALQDCKTIDARPYERPNRAARPLDGVIRVQDKPQDFPSTSSYNSRKGQHSRAEQWQFVDNEIE